LARRERSFKEVSAMVNLEKMRSMSSVLSLVFALTFGATNILAAAKEAPIVPNRIVVVFKGQALPADAAQQIQQAGGKLVKGLTEVGIAIAAPNGVDAATLISNLRKSSSIQDADYDRVMTLIAPGVAAAGQRSATSPDTHFPHPLPDFSPLLPADFLYTSTSMEWAVKRVGAQGGGIPGGGSGAWDVTKGAGVTIAILDTGINPVHPDISPNLIGAYSEATFSTPCDDGSAYDQLGHGTFTASLAAGAAGPGTGLLIGVAPEAKILSIKVLERFQGAGDDLLTQCLNGNGSGDFSWALSGIVHATEMGADVISMSFGGIVPRNLPGSAGAALWSAFDRVTNFATSRGVVLVASAGNNGLDVDMLGPLVELPAESPNVIAVVATTNPALLPPTPPARQPCLAGQDCLAFYSDYGNSEHGMAAPGGDLPAGGCSFDGATCFSTGFVFGACSAGEPGTDYGLPDSTATPPTSMGCFQLIEDGAGNHLWYVQAIGTSAAAPLVAGVAALVKSVRPTLNQAQVRTILQQTAQDIGKPGYDALFNFGLVNATAAVKAANQ
jgi:lantibiotic leader peptide-processing serine protease